MIVEAIAVGTELLLGHTVNSNAALIGSRLADAGLEHHFSTAVGDHPGRMVDAIRLAMGRADAVILTGGIGPTQDDLTREAICEATGRPMLYSDEYASRLRRWWAARGREMPDSNLKQAEYPEGATLLDNPKGTAPAIQLEHEGVVIFALPGVPAELEVLLDKYVLPLLRERSGEGVVLSRVIRTYGQSESRVAEMLADIFEETGNPSMAFLASAAEIKVRLTAHADTEAGAEALIAPFEAAVRERMGSLVFGIDDETIESIVLRMAEEKGWTLATAESATGGKVAARITAVPGASRVFRGAIVAYQDDVKKMNLSVGDDLIAEHGVVSEPVAMAMAEGVARALDADVGIAITGSAGPEPLEEAAGTMVVAVRTPEGTMARTLRLPGDRERVRTYTSTGALHMARLAMAGKWWSGRPKDGRWV
ncbi:MAG: competence/damage-inducible protein A [Acidimicrobiia bacterium]|nr:competence/damage-inducible protein A [Acidimicrobiia bacterium]